MTVKHNIVTVQSTQTHMTSWNPLRSESSIIIKNISFNNIYIGANGVTTSNYGFRLLPEQTLSITLGPYDELYGITDSTAEAAILVLEN